MTDVCSQSCGIQRWKSSQNPKMIESSLALKWSLKKSHEWTIHQPFWQFDKTTWRKSRCYIAQKSSAEKLGSDTILMILRMIFWRLLKSGLGGLNNIPFLMNGQTSCYHTLKWFYRVIEHKCRKKLFERILKDALSNISSRSIAIFTFRWLLPMGLLLINGA